MDHAEVTTFFASVYICHEGPNSQFSSWLIILKDCVTISPVPQLYWRARTGLPKSWRPVDRFFSRAFLSSQLFCKVCWRQRRAWEVFVLQQPTDYGNSATFSGMTRRCVIRMQDMKCNRFTFVFHLPNPCYIWLETVLSIYALHNCFMFLDQRCIT